MNFLVPLNQAIKQSPSTLSDAGSFSINNTDGIPIGFAFKRDSFVGFLEMIDADFEKKIPDQKKAFDNPAGRLIDAIEEQLPINQQFIQDLEQSHAQTQPDDWIPLKQLETVL